MTIARHTNSILRQLANFLENDHRKESFGLRRGRRARAHAAPRVVASDRRAVEKESLLAAIAQIADDGLIQSDSLSSTLSAPSWRTRAASHRLAPRWSARDQSANV